jgi:hypothetical protein
MDFAHVASRFERTLIFGKGKNNLNAGQGARPGLFLEQLQRDSKRVAAVAVVAAPSTRSNENHCAGTASRTIIVIGL